MCVGRSRYLSPPLSLPPPPSLCMYIYALDRVCVCMGMEWIHTRACVYWRSHMCYVYVYVWMLLKSIRHACAVFHIQMVWGALDRSLLRALPPLPSRKKHANPIRHTRPATPSPTPPSASERTVPLCASSAQSGPLPCGEVGGSTPSLLSPPSSSRVLCSLALMNPLLAHPLLISPNLTARTAASRVNASPTPRMAGREVDDAIPFANNATLRPRGETKG